MSYLSFRTNTIASKKGYFLNPRWWKTCRYVLWYSMDSSHTWIRHRFSCLRLAIWSYQFFCKDHAVGLWYEVGYSLCSLWILLLEKRRSWNRHHKTGCCRNLTRASRIIYGLSNLVKLNLQSRKLCRTADKLDNTARRTPQQSKRSSMRDDWSTWAQRLPEKRIYNRRSIVSIVDMSCMSSNKATNSQEKARIQERVEAMVLSWFSEYCLQNTMICERNTSKVEPNGIGRVQGIII